jgi:transposase
VNTRGCRRGRTTTSTNDVSGVAPLPAGSGLTSGRHRLNLDGNRQANNALWRVVMTRIRIDQRTKAYITRRISEGKTKKEAIRCLKRYVAREIYRVLIACRRPPADRPAVA